MKLKFLHVNTYSKAITVLPHVHKSWELIYYIKGNLYSKYGKNPSGLPYGQEEQIVYIQNAKTQDVFNLESNSFVLFPPGTLHDENHQSPSSLIAIGFDAEDFPLVLEAKQYVDYDLSILTFIQKIAEEYTHKKPFFNKNIEAHLTQLLVEIQRNYNNKPQSSHFNPMKYIKRYIDDYFATDLQIKDLADSAGYSVSRFRELFKEYTGFSPKGYVMNKRIDYAKQLLVKTTLPIKDISYQCGFNDYSIFNKFFVSRTGVNPKDYRKQEKIKGE